MKIPLKGFIASLLLILVALLLIGGGAYVYAHNKHSNQSATTQATSTEQSSDNRPSITAVQNSTISIYSLVTINGTNFDPLGSYAGNSRVFVKLKNISNGQEGFIDEDNAQGSGQRFFSDHIYVSMAPLMYALSAMDNSHSPDKLIPVVPGQYLLSISVDGRGTSNTVPIVITK